LLENKARSIPHTRTEGKDTLVLFYCWGTKKWL